MLPDSRNGNTRFQFRKAIKRDAKLRLAVAGPGGSGKTYTLLKLAAELGGRIAVVDSEHGSASKYADEFQFDVMELSEFDPEIVPLLIRDVAAQGYSSLIFDSWSHFWFGPAGELEQVDQITARMRSNNSFAAWRHVSPKHTRMVDAMLSAPIHIMVSMRVKTEWVVEKDEKTGKTCPRKVGLQPVMRDGVEYEFDVCGDLDQENNLIVTKSRCPKLSGKMIAKPGAEMARILREWLNTGVPAEIDPDPQGLSIDIGPNQYGTQAASDYVRDQKIADLQAQAHYRQQQPPPKPVIPELTATRSGEIKQAFAVLREKIGEVRYGEELRILGIASPLELSTQKAREFYRRLSQIAIAEVA